ncbi:DoxX family membrane protein [Paenibacillus sp.]|uniref:DoxX family membrane protein n=1 Tax=Paenibacillus sp. TaxID=58172 RepID=UPI0028115E65|nr:DoxX family membrane protein [Paenibacillus sp.]
MKRISAALAASLLVLLPLPAFAHVKWFDGAETPVKETLENVLSPLFMTVALLAAVILGLLPQVDAKLTGVGGVKRLEGWFDSKREWTYPILRFGTAAALLIQLATGAVFAPDIHVTQLQLYIGAAVIVLLLLPFAATAMLAAVGILALFALSVVEYGVFHMLDYGFYVAVAVALAVRHTKYREFGMPFLYLGTGLSLCWVAVEKWVFPGMSIGIVHDYEVPTFGFPADVFVNLSAFIEFVVGYLLVVGLLNRFLAMVLTGIFILTTTVFGWVEIIGHLMPHIILILFIIEGVSFYHPPIKMHKSVLDQIVFVSLNFLFTLGTMILLYYRFA